MRAFVNEEEHPVVQFDFDNGWTVSIVKRGSNDVCNCAVASWPTRNSADDKIQHHGSELSDQEIAELMGDISTRKKV